MGAGRDESTEEPAAHLAGIFLARHGETDYNAGRRFQGLLPVPLNETGRCQAAELAERVVPYGFRALWCSPLARARETADIVGARIGLEPLEDARLVETDTGEWTDRLFSDVEKEAPEAFAAFLRADPKFAFPGGESYRHQATRSIDALGDIAGGARPTLVVCHAMVIRLVVMHLGRGNHPVANAALVEL
jgi:broad specificity phosphatase PhoE